MLKPFLKQGYYNPHLPAAFRRLCVETLNLATLLVSTGPAAFRRLCVETNRKATTVRE